MAGRELTADDIVKILKRRWPILLLMAFVGTGIGWEAARVLPKRYVSKTVVLVEPPTVPGDYVKPVVIDNINQHLASMQQEILSRSRLEPIIKKFGLYSDEVDRVPMDALVGRLQKTITITPIEAMAQTSSQGLPGFTVSVTFGDPHMAQQICSTITSMFTEANSRARQQTVEETSSFLSAQLDEAKGKLDEQDARLAEFKRRYLGALPDDSQTNLNVLTGLTSQLDATTQALSRAQQDKSFTESMLAQQLANSQPTQNGQTTDALVVQLNTLRSQLTALQSKYTDDYPDVIKTKSDIAALEKKMTNPESQALPAGMTTKAPTEPAQIQSLRAQIHQHEVEIKERTAQQDELQQQIKTYQSRVQSSPAVEQEYKSLTRDYQTALDFYNDLLKKRDQSALATDLERRQEGEQFQVLDAADVPSKPSFPNAQLFMLGGAGGGVSLALGLFVMMELMDSTLRNEKDVEVLLHLPVLAMLPAIKAVRSKKASAPALGAAARS